MDGVGCKEATVVGEINPIIDPSYPENFVRCAKWSPDGKQVIAHCEDRTFEVITLPDKIERDIPPFKALPQADAVLEFAWYPWSNIDTPGSSCFVASVKDSPVKLLDANDGRLRASYRIVDHVERQVAPHCLAFNPTGTQLYCGHEDAIEVFDFQTPGEGLRIRTTPSRKSKDGMRGIVSSLSFCPDFSGLYAASSFSSAITLFTENTGEDPVAYLDGMTSAITQVKFNPTQPHMLFAAQRRSEDILCWDVREPLEVMCKFRRKGARTNQKIHFDIDPTGRWLASGDEDGDINFFDLSKGMEEPSLQFHAHNDAIGSVNFHPTQPVLLSASGSRHFREDPTDLPSDSDSSDDNSEESDESTACYRRRKHVARPHPTDTSVRIWSLNLDVTFPAIHIPPMLQ